VDFLNQNGLPCKKSYKPWLRKRKGKDRVGRIETMRARNNFTRTIIDLLSEN
jgi:hypothetical protein